VAVVDNNAGSWTAAELLTDVRQKGRIPAGTLDYTDAILLEEASRAIWSFAGWAMTKASDGRLLAMLQRSSATAFTTPYAVGREVELPFDAVGDTFDSVVWVDSTGVEARLQLIEEASQPLYDTPTASGDPWGYSLVDGRLRLYPRPASAGNVRIAYQRRLPRLVAAAQTRTVTSQTLTATDLTLVHAATGQLVFAGDRFDVVNPVAPYRYYVSNALATTVPNAFTITSTSCNTGNFSAGIAITLDGLSIVKSGTSPYVHLPLEFKQCLTQKIAAQVLGDIGDAQGAMMLEQKAEAELARVVQLLTPRAKTSRVKVVNPHSHLRARRARGMW
jgi:hypothetical protein